MEYTDQIRKDLIAFANTDGGVIYVGVNDCGETICVRGKMNLPSQ